MSQLLMAVLISLYLLARAGPPRRWPSQPALALLTGFFLLVSFFSLFLLVDVSTIPSYRLSFRFFENPLISLALVLLIQFAYRYPDRQVQCRHEMYAALLFSGGYALVETGYAFWRIQQLLSTGTVFFRQPYADLALLICVLWLVWAFLRRGDHTGRVFAAIFLIIVAVALINLLHSLQLVSTFVQEISSTMGILVSMFLFAMAYLHSQQAHASFTIKLAGGLLTALMVVLSSMIWAIAPLYATQYQPSLPEQRMLRLTPQAGGGYRASWQALNWDADYGTHLDSIGPNQPVAYPFQFPFFGTLTKQLWLDDRCALNIDRIGRYPNREYHYGNQPAIFPLYAEYLSSAAATNAGMFVKQADGRLTLTCLNLPLRSQPDQLVSVQAMLDPQGVIELRYPDLPSGLRFYANDHPQAVPWFLGLVAGHIPDQRPQPLSLDGIEQVSNARGLIYDEHLVLRSYFHELIAPLLLIIAIANILLLIGVPLILHYILLRPLNNLVSGVKQAGQASSFSPIPVATNDEIGLLTTSFNRMGQDLALLIDDLEQRVANRTAELRTLNADLNKFSLVINQSPSSIMLTDAEAHIQYVNPAFTKITGYSLDEIYGQNPRLLKSGLTSDETYIELWETIKHGRVWRGELCNRARDGSNYWIWAVIAPIFGPEREITHYATISEDISLRKAFEQAMIESEHRYRMLFELESDAIFLVRNADGQILEANQAAANLYGYSQAELLDMRNTDLSAEPEATRSASQAPINTDEVVVIPLRWHRRRNGEIFPVDITARFFILGSEPVCLVAIRDCTERHATQSTLERMASTDPLTGIFNRRHFFDQAKQLVAAPAQVSPSSAILMIDIDHFKQLNDTYGHAAGDQALIAVAQIIKSQTRSHDLLARYGGEEFVLLLPATTSDLACQVAERITSAIRSTNFDLGGTQPVRISVSIGIACAHAPLPELDPLLHQADESLYQAKANGRDRWVCYSAKEVQA
ncbi:MAG: diguanylate cyclase [Oscillochloridaceae bacterium umkhey_bin13]